MVFPINETIPDKSAEERLEAAMPKLRERDIMGGGIHGEHRDLLHRTSDFGYVDNPLGIKSKVDKNRR